MKSNIFSMKIFLVGLSLLIVSLGIYYGFFQKSAEPVPTNDPSAIITAIARDIERSKKEFPQLRDFKIQTHLDVDDLKISYDFSTHEPERRPGWRGGVPEPNDDGIWLYIDLHEPDSQAQIHTQPVMPDLCVGGKKVAFLIIEGKQTQSISSRIYEFFKKYGVAECGTQNQDDKFWVGYHYSTEGSYFDAKIDNGKLTYTFADYESIKDRCADWLAQAPCWTKQDLKTTEAQLTATEWGALRKFIEDSGVMGLADYYGPAPGERCYPYVLNVSLGVITRKITYCSGALGPVWPEAFASVSKLILQFVDQKFIDR